jgi:hypothetical protein
VEEMPAEHFDLNVDAWFGEACEPTLAHVVGHMKRIRKADPDEPILLSAEGHVFDGLHRLAKCALEEIPTIRYKRFPVNPEPFEIVDFVDFQKARPRIAATLAWMEEHVL